MSVASPDAAPPLPAELAGLRVALVHDWLTGMRGGEKVLEVLAELFPRADLYTLIHVPHSTSPTIENRRVVASWMNRLPRAHRQYRWLLPLFPSWADRLDLSAYDLVISSSHCVAKGARARADAIHVCYCHTPMRYVWDRFEDYFGRARGPKKWLLQWQAARLRAWDRRSAGRVDRYLANSRFVRRRILDYYGVAATRVAVLHPPVHVAAFAPGPAGRRTEDYLVVSALVPYKRVDVAVEACARSGRHLTVAGSGPERGRLEALARRFEARDRIHFRGFVPEGELAKLMATHRALLFPGVEDFGITPVEATACGLPVVALGVGGVLDTVVPGLNGLLYPEPTVQGMLQALDDFEAGPVDWDPEAMRRHAARFDTRCFRADLVGHLRDAVISGPSR
jgi:glycosyltransferase involved in cell wall biosynthesis